MRSSAASTVVSYNASQEEEETANLLSGKLSPNQLSLSSSYPNPYRKKNKASSQGGVGSGTTTHRVSFAEQLFGKTYDINGSVVGSISGSVASASSSNLRRKVPRLSHRHNATNGTSTASSNTVEASSSIEESTALLTKRLLKFTYLKKNATLLSIMALGVMIFMGGMINITGTMRIEEDVDASLRGGSSGADDARGLGYDNNSVLSSSGGIMSSNYHPSNNDMHPMSKNINESSNKLDYNAKSITGDSVSTTSQQQQIDWDKVPPHLRGYYAKTFGPPPNENGKGDSMVASYRKEVDDYEQSQFANKEQAKAIQSIGQEAVLGFRPMTGRDYHAQGELNKELTGGGMVVGHDPSALGMDSEEQKRLAASQPISSEETSLLRGGNQPDYQQLPAVEIDSEEQKRLAAQEAALTKTSTAESDARQRRQDELALLRASAGLTGSYYSEPQEKSSSQSMMKSPQQTEEAQPHTTSEQEPIISSIQDVLESTQQVEKTQQQVAEPQSIFSIENDVESPQQSDETQQQPLDDDVKQKIERMKEYNAQKMAQGEKVNYEVSEKQKRAEDEALVKLTEQLRQRKEEPARWEVEKAEEEHQEWVKKVKAEEEKQRQQNGSQAQRLMDKYTNVSFLEQTGSQVQPKDDPNSPDLSIWRSDANAKFHERFKAQEKVDHTAPKKESLQSGVSLLTEKPRQQDKPTEETNYRLRIAKGDLPFDEWRSMMKEKLHNEIQKERAKNSPPPPQQPSPHEVKDKVSQKMEEVEQAQNAVMNGESSDLSSINALQKELSELMQLMGGG